MSIVSHKHRLVFFPIAKNCSTSIKHLFYQLETGQKFKQARKHYGLAGHVHHYYPTRNGEKFLNFFDSYDTITIVRDPIKRFLSTYGERIGHVKVLERAGTVEKIRSDGYPVQPSLEEFVQNLEYYCEVSSRVRRHIAPQKNIIGPFFPRIKKVYEISQIPEFEAFMSERYGKPITLAQDQTGGPKFTIADLSQRSLEKMVDYYKPDYKMLSQFYDPPK